eukprot:GHVU01128567.1.p4 GENE.GHVU01128567.1~~GHVU01128567.1.p4  ORF type:complete len:117 (+),score=18.93 GHVU01128567.1:276-626(+)
MNGREVFKFTTREVPAVILRALRAADMGIDDVDWLLVHQANSRILSAVADRLGISQSKVISNLKECGNTSAASIPLALDSEVRCGRVKPGDIIVMAGFGAGLSMGATVVRWSGSSE